MSDEISYFKDPVLIVKKFFLKYEWTCHIRGCFQLQSVQGTAMCVSNRELVKGNVITDFKWEVKEDMDAVLRRERTSAIVGNFKAREENLDHLIK